MRLKIIFICLFFSFSCYSQTEDAWIYFKDKPSESSFLANPITMLSQSSLDKRILYNIPLDSKDVPVHSSYILQIKAVAGIAVLAKSKWLNALHIQGNQAVINSLKQFSFVEKIDFADKSLNTSGKTQVSSKVTNHSDKLKVAVNFNYGNAANQIQMLKGEVLHQNNFTGKGMKIAVIDAGFPNVDQLAAFERIRSNKQILGGYNFVERSANYYKGSSHGTMVLSTIAGFVENQFVGTAPDAQFYLFITEDAAKETPLEESLWVEAAERADSLGVAIINTSLGYTTFDNPKYNYTYQHMDGKTTFISRGAEIAFSRGMIVVNSAGNEGNATWHYISAPADAVNVLSIGAVNSTRQIANFSSYGPTSDNRIKPDVCAQGAGVTVINSNGTLINSNGTSFSAPILTGVIACLWQAFPNKSNFEVTQLIKQSAHLFKAPTNQEGYGIPNFETIYNLMHIADSESENADLLVYPNPSSEEINIKFPINVHTINVAVYSLLGKKLIEKQVEFTNPVLDIKNLENGLYVLQYSYDSKLNTLKIIKADAK